MKIYNVFRFGREGVGGTCPMAARVESNFVERFEAICKKKNFPFDILHSASKKDVALHIDRESDLEMFEQQPNGTTTPVPTQDEETLDRVANILWNLNKITDPKHNKSKMAILDELARITKTAKEAQFMAYHAKKSQEDAEYENSAKI